MKYYLFKDGVCINCFQFFVSDSGMVKVIPETNSYNNSSTYFSLEDARDVWIAMRKDGYEPVDQSLIEAFKVEFAE